MALLAPRGISLGEHGRLGRCDDPLYSEIIHVPLLVRLPEAFAVGVRSKAIVQPADVAATLCEWAGIEASKPPNAFGMGRSLLPLVGGQPLESFDRAVAIGDRRERTIVVPAWSMRVPDHPTSTEIAHNDLSATTVNARSLPPKTELFAKPDDWFEVNELSNRCPEIVEQLQAVLADFESTCESDDLANPIPLGEMLTLGID